MTCAAFESNSHVCNLNMKAENVNVWGVEAHKGALLRFIKDLFITTIHQSAKIVLVL